MAGCSGAGSGASGAVDSEFTHLPSRLQSQQPPRPLHGAARQHTFLRDGSWQIDQGGLRRTAPRPTGGAP